MPVCDGVVVAIVVVRPEEKEGGSGSEKLLAIALETWNEDSREIPS